MRILIIGLIALFLGASCTNNQKSIEEMQAEQEALAKSIADSIAQVEANNALPKTVVETAMLSEEFTTLCALLEAAGLSETLQGEGPFTLFAPNDDAFAELSEAELKSLMDPKNIKKLQSILTYHVVLGSVHSTEFKAGKNPTLNGAECNIETSNNAIMVDKASVIRADIECSNGVIHVIDKVLMPN